MFVVRDYTRSKDFSSKAQVGVGGVQIAGINKAEQGALARRGEGIRLPPLHVEHALGRNSTDAPDGPRQFCKILAHAGTSLSRNHRADRNREPECVLWSFKVESHLGRSHFGRLRSG